MGKMTFVVEYEDGKEPPVHANMDVLGGKLEEWHLAMSFRIWMIWNLIIRQNLSE